MKTDVLRRACQENPALLKSLNDWLDELEVEAWRLTAVASGMDNILHAQGRAYFIPVLKAKLKKLVSAKST